MSTAPFAELSAQLDHCTLQDSQELQRILAGMRKAVAQGRPYDRLQGRFVQLLERSQQLVNSRAQAAFRLHYDEQLPLCQKHDELLALLAQHQVVVVAGETGSGKTTQLPKLCLELGRGLRGRIGHTQPRRLAARAVASRLAEELGTELGQVVGYQVRFVDESSAATRVKLMTDGILLAETQHDPLLLQYDTLIIDEAHERSLNIDFLLGYIRNILPKRPDLKVIVTSATIDLQRFSQHFNNCPIFQVEGRTYPVEVRYRPLLDAADEEAADRDLTQYEGILAAVEELAQDERQQHQGPGDVLVFLSGEREIREAADTLRKANLRDTEVLPLYARLSAREQQKIFHPRGQGRRIVLATNVAETSLTVPGIRYVIDTGVARISRYSYRSKVQRLPIEPISQASANQRKGRCGRLGPGVCIRLYSEEDFSNRPEFTDAEILRTNLASVILQMLALKLGDIEDFPFLEKPDSRFVNDGFRLLQELGAVDKHRRLTPQGRQLARLPIDPQLGRMLLEGARLNALREVLIIVSALSVQDPRERPVERQQAADEKHRQWAHEESDFLSLVQLWDGYEEQRQALSQNQLRQYCQKQFLNFMRMREWRDVHRQLHLMLKEMKLAENREPASYQNVHQALIAGLLGNLGMKTDEGDYLGARNRRFMLFPGSGLFKKKPKWVVAAEMVETTKLYARTLARIEPEWVEPLAQALLKDAYLEPHWERKRAEVVAYQQRSLYGLILVPKRKVSYAQVEPELCQQIFIREALVNGDYDSKAPFFQHNRALLEEVETLEAKARRRDILVDEETLYEFYLEKLHTLGGEQVANGAAFESWRRKLEQRNPQALFLTKEYLMRHGADEVTQQQYPDKLVFQGMELPLHYHFEPGHEADGVTLDLPAALLVQFPQERLQWLVPGMLKDKCVALLKGLPKQLRRNFVPIPDYVDAALAALPSQEGSLTEALSAQLRRMSGVLVEESQWREVKLEPHHLMRIRVLDGRGKVIGQGRDLLALRERFADQAQAQLATLPATGLEQQGLTVFPQVALPQELTREQGGIRIKLYPALVDEGDSVAVQLFDHPQRAKTSMRLGLLKLYRLQLQDTVKYLQKNLPKLNQSALLFVGVGRKEELFDDLINAALETVFLQTDAWPRDQQAFAESLAAQRAEVVGAANELAQLVANLLESRNRISKRLQGKVSLAWALIFADIKQQLEALIFKGFISATPLTALRRMPTYLKAIELRLERFQNHLPKEQQASQELGQRWQQYLARREALQRLGREEPLLDEYRWLLEEYRISLFAQTLGTLQPVSAKRLDKLWEQIPKA
ncbi:ATP-dependent RNA helicase HrpA [Balneatrix alpica]|uniref:ATP-dependent RNA helicase HrpA n=1 Tax=Balneatrix alpica TaxID=75684 RepID=A0ABV5Z8Q5_9GAMM|nr:ATP-dependent RNA helicase HrpA [Balneatrix alpica]